MHTTDERPGRGRARPLPAGALLLGLALASACVSPAPRRPAPSEPPLPAARRDAPGLAAQVEELARSSTPGAEHRELDRFAGAWDVGLVALGPAGEESELARGDALIGWVLDGRYLRWDAGLEIGGRRRETSGYLGFDRRARQYVLLMITSLSTGMSVARGVGEPARTGIRLSLDQIDPVTGAPVRMTSLLRALDRDHFVLDQLATDAAGSERVVQRTHYRRAGPAP